MRKASFLFALVVIALTALALGCAACGRSSGRADERLKIAVSIFPVYDLTRRVAGPDADVALAPREWRPTARVASDARLGVVVGLGFDPWMESLLKDAAPSARVLRVGDRVPTLTRQDRAGAIDPYCWLDPQRARLIAKAVVEELARLDSKHATAYRARGAALDAQLATLDREIEEKVKRWPSSTFVVLESDFASFDYFADRYGLQERVAFSVSSDNSAPLWSVDATRELVRVSKARVLFREAQVDPREAQHVADEVKLPLRVLDPIGGDPDTDTYEKLLRFDVAALASALE